MKYIFAKPVYHRSACMCALLNQYSPVPRAQLDCWVARAQVYSGLGNVRMARLLEEKLRAPLSDDVPPAPRMSTRSVNARIMQGVPTKVKFFKF